MRKKIHASTKKPCYEYEPMKGQTLQDSLKTTICCIVYEEVTS